MPIQINNGFSATTISATTFYGDGSNITGIGSSPFSGGTVTGPTNFTNGLTASTISATTYLNLPIDVRVTGGTYSSGTTIFTNNTGGTFSVSGYYTGNTEIHTTGITNNNSNVITLSDNTGGTYSTTFNTVSGLTVNGTLVLSDTTIPTVASGTLQFASYNQQGFSVPHVYDTFGNKIEITRDNLFIGKNTSASAMTKGQVVYISGSTGGVPIIQLAQGNSITSLNVIGVLYENVASGNYGRIMTLGNLENITLSSYNNGDILYVSPTIAGSFTSTKPTYPNYAQQIGVVINNGNATGILGVYIRGIQGINNGDNAILNSVSATTLAGDGSAITNITANIPYGTINAMLNGTFFQ